MTRFQHPDSGRPAGVWSSPGPRWVARRLRDFRCLLERSRATGPVILRACPCALLGWRTRLNLTGRCEMPEGESAGLLHDDAPYLKIGQGPPLVMVPGLTPDHDVPRGWQRQIALASARPLARDFTVYVVNRKRGLQPGVAVGPVVPADPTDMLVTLDAEDVFDVEAGLPCVTAPTLVIGGGHDHFYPQELFHGTATGVQDGRVHIFPGWGHVRRAAPPRPHTSPSASCSASRLMAVSCVYFCGPRCPGAVVGPSLGAVGLQIGTTCGG